MRNAQLLTRCLLLILLLAGGTLAGCEKTIHEVRSAVAAP
jgi:hypothetical protein